jgi:hypothetical protein
MTAQNATAKRVTLLLAPPDRDEDRIVSKDDLKVLLAKLPTITQLRGKS